MPAFLRKSLHCAPLLLLVGCASRQEPVPNAPPAVSTNAAIFNPLTGEIPLPNILATAQAADPITGLLQGQATVPATAPLHAGTPMNPAQALAYINAREVGWTGAVAGVNAPIYLRFSYPVQASTLTPANIKVFLLAADSASPSATENKALGFTDVTGMFTFQYAPAGTATNQGAATGTDLLLFPSFPLAPGSRYAYVVTNGVLDAATGAPIIPSAYFQYLLAPTVPTGAAAALAPIWSDVTAGGNILLSGYNKFLNDLVAAQATTGVASRAQVALMGRFITSGAGYVAKNAAGAMVPVEAALRQFAAGLAMGGFGPGWSNTIVPTAPATSVTVLNTPAFIGGYWSQVLGANAPAVPAVPASIGTIALGSINSADLGVDPVVVAGNPAAMVQATAAFNDAPAVAVPNSAGVVQPFRDSLGNLAGFYNVPTTVPFVYVAPAGKAPAGGWPLVIYQHGIQSQKETVLTIAGALTAAGYAIVAIDLPMHGALSLGATTGAAWGQNFMAVGAPLAVRSNVQQAAFNLHRLELTAALGGFASLGTAAPAMPAIPTGGSPLINYAPTPYHYVGISLGSIVGAYYLAGNASLYPPNTLPSSAPYLQTTLANDMKGLLSVPGGRLAYLIQASPSFGATIDTSLAAAGVPTGSPTYNNFFQATQTVSDIVDPATMTTPLGALLPSRLSGRLLIQEATSSTFDTLGNPTNGDQVITNPFTRYFGNALGGEAVLQSPAAAAIAPNFFQLGYGSADVIPAQFMFTLNGAASAPKSEPAAQSLAATSPSEGYFQFNQKGILHGALLGEAGAADAVLMQTQMVYFMGPTGASIVVDPVAIGDAAAAAAVVMPDFVKVQVAPTWTILGH